MSLCDKIVTNLASATHAIRAVWHIQLRRFIELSSVAAREICRRRIAINWKMFVSLLDLFMDQEAVKKW